MPFPRHGTTTSTTAVRYLAAASRALSFFLIILRPTSWYHHSSSSSSSMSLSYRRVVVVRPHPHRRSLTHRGRLIMSPASRSTPGSTIYPSLSPPRTPHHRMCGCGRRPGCWGWRRAAPYLPPTKWASLSRPPPRAPPYAILPPTPPAVGEAARKRFAPPARYASDEVLRGTAQGTLSRLSHCLLFPGERNGSIGVSDRFLR